MKTIDTTKGKRYSAFIPAFEAILLSPKGTKLEIIMNDHIALKNIKAYLIEHQIGFREIYDEDQITLQFKV